MRVLIIEDEKIAFQKLKAMLQLLVPDIEIVGHASSVIEGKKLVEKHKTVDLAFFDVQLEDGLSFTILEQTNYQFPIIFTTAYDDYAIRAFDHHSIAYLLKPIQKKDLEKALKKYSPSQYNADYSYLLKKAIEEVRKKRYKERFTVKIGDKIRLFETDEIACFFSREKGSFLCSSSNKHFAVDYPLDEIVALIDPTKFFRINRKHIVSINAIEKLVQFTNSRLRVVLNIEFDEDLIVAREKVKAFKNWLEGDTE